MTEATQQVPQRGDAVILYGTETTVTKVEPVHRQTDGSLAHFIFHVKHRELPPIHAKPSDWYQLSNGEWTTYGRLLSREQKLEYRKLTGKNPTNEEEARALLQEG